MLGKSITKNSMTLGLFAICTAGILAATFNATIEKIMQSERKAAQKALLEIVPAVRIDNDMLEDVWEIPKGQYDELNLKDETKIHIARKNGRPIAVIIPATAPDGYSGEIKIIVGVNADGTVAGVRALSHKETPGLGDKIDLNKDTWILGFNGKSLSDPTSNDWKVKKDGGYFDQFTGATITPRAVVTQVKNTLEYFQRNKDIIFSTPAVTQTESEQP